MFYSFRTLVCRPSSLPFTKREREITHRESASTFDLKLTWSRDVAALLFSCFLTMPIAPNSIEEFLCGFQTAPLGFGDLEFRWHEFTANCLGKNGLSNAVHSLLPL